MINLNYYRKLLFKYNIQNDSSQKTASLTMNIIWANYQRTNIHFNFPDNFIFNITIKGLYKQLSNMVFTNYADFPPLLLGDKLKKNGDKTRTIYTIYKKSEKGYFLADKSKSLQYTTPFTLDKLLKLYIPVKQNGLESTLLKYKDYFHSINTNTFLPTHFTKKIVIISSKTIWDNMEDKSNIPSIYLPNKRENNNSPLKTIPALEDCISYFTSKYEVCYEQLLLKNIKIDTILLCNNDIDCIPQIIQDQSTYKFKLIVLTNEIESINTNGLMTWNWKKEEIEILK